jgi:uncharacterized OB-fold protein
MALTKCRECGKEVSTDTVTCPHCGVVDPSGSGRPAPEPKVIEKHTVVHKRGGGFARFLLWIILIVFLAVFGAWSLGILHFG